MPREYRHMEEYQPFVSRLIHDILCQNTDKQDSHPIDFDDMVGLEQSGVVGPDMQIGIDDREFRALFQKQKVRNPVIRLMAADGNHVRTHAREIPSLHYCL